MRKGKSHKADFLKRRTGRNTICIFRESGGEHSVFMEGYQSLLEITPGRYSVGHSHSFSRQAGRGSERCNNSLTALQSGFQVKTQTQDTCYLYLGAS